SPLPAWRPPCPTPPRATSSGRSPRSTARPPEGAGAAPGAAARRVRPPCYNSPLLRASTPRGHFLRGGSQPSQESADVGEPRVIIVGGGLAGSEAAWQAGRRGLRVDLHEMRPVRTTPVHATSDLAELVCSNSLKSNLLDTASGLLKEEMRRCDSLIIRVADTVRVPAGGALAVDRERFARGVTEAIQTLPNVRVVREEMKAIPSDGPCIIATGPLASDAIAESIAGFTGRGYLYFYDAI